LPNRKYRDHVRPVAVAVVVDATLTRSRRTGRMRPASSTEEPAAGRSPPRGRSGCLPWMRGAEIGQRVAESSTSVDTQRNALVAESGSRGATYRIALCLRRAGSDPARPKTLRARSAASSSASGSSPKESFDRPVSSRSHPSQRGCGRHCLPARAAPEVHVGASSRGSHHRPGAPGPNRGPPAPAASLCLVIRRNGRGASELSLAASGAGIELLLGSGF